MESYKVEFIINRITKEETIKADSHEHAAQLIKEKYHDLTYLCVSRIE